MFRGTSNHTIDPKGRIIIPSRFREQISDSGNGVMVSKLDKGLVAYTFDEWNKIEAKIMFMAEKSESMRRFRRVFIGGAFECICDKQSRILIPPMLREYAGLVKEIVLIGVLTHFEIRSFENWDNENKVMEKEMVNEEVRNEIAKLGL
ncbi:MAG: division/cell wall cluster transcriptional repressor MraZ [Deltaproteobacteria bacterium]|nr:division/cell wall cluster transcriptional repressor MraZ [Deltaproteobacteria bacterium]